MYANAIQVNEAFEIICCTKMPFTFDLSLCRYETFETPITDFHEI